MTGSFAEACRGMTGCGITVEGWLLSVVVLLVAFALISGLRILWMSADIRIAERFEAFMDRIGRSE